MQLCLLLCCCLLFSVLFVLMIMTLMIGLQYPSKSKHFHVLYHRISTGSLKYAKIQRVVNIIIANLYIRCIYDTVN